MLPRRRVRAARNQGTGGSLSPSCPRQDQERSSPSGPRWRMSAFHSQYGVRNTTIQRLPERPGELQAAVTLHLHAQHEPLVELVALLGRVSRPPVAASGAIDEHVLKAFDLCRQRSVTSRDQLLLRSALLCVDL